MRNVNRRRADLASDTVASVPGPMDVYIAPSLVVQPTPACVLEARARRDAKPTGRDALTRLGERLQSVQSDALFLRSLFGANDELVRAIRHEVDQIRRAYVRQWRSSPALSTDG